MAQYSLHTHALSVPWKSRCTFFYQRSLLTRMACSSLFCTRRWGNCQHSEMWQMGYLASISVDRAMSDSMNSTTTCTSSPDLHALALTVTQKPWSLHPRCTRTSIRNVHGIALYLWFDASPARCGTEQNNCKNVGTFVPKTGLSNSSVCLSSRMEQTKKLHWTLCSLNFLVIHP